MRPAIDSTMCCNVYSVIGGRTFSTTMYCGEKVKTCLSMLCRHEELLSIDDGVYAAMWIQQQTKLAEEEQQMSESDVTDSAVTADTVDSQPRLV